MSFRGYQGKVDPQVGHENSGTDVETQLIQLTQVQVAHTVSFAVSQALAQKMQ